MSLVGTEQTVWVVDRAPKSSHLVGHTKGYVQVLLEDAPTVLGAVVRARIVGAHRWHVDGEILEVVHPGPDGDETKESGGDWGRGGAGVLRVTGEAKGATRGEIGARGVEGGEGRGGARGSAGVKARDAGRGEERRVGVRARDVLAAGLLGLGIVLLSVGIPGAWASLGEFLGALLRWWCHHGVVAYG